MEKMNRRKFIGTTVANTMAMTTILCGASDNTAKPKLKTGLIGCGWYGMVDVKAAFKVGGVEIVALCDVDSEHLKSSADEVEKIQGSRPKTYKSYQELLDTPGLESVIIATPPHWHALMFIAALEKGLDIYCEKPLSYDINEGKAMVAAAKKSGRIVQIGFQRRKSKAIQQARQYIQEGNIGKIIQAEAQIHYTAEMRDTTLQEPPASLDWNLWCGPGPKLPYCPQIGHFAWRLEKESGHGHLVDWGIHLIDATRWILGEKMPRSVQAAGGIYYFKDKITTPDILTVHFDFDACPVIWHHRMWGAQEYDPQVSNGIFLYGEKGTVFVTDRKWVTIPKGRDSQQKVNEVSADMGTEHMAEFLEAVQSRKQPICTTEEGYYSTATVKLAMIAYNVESKITWDQASQTITGNPRAAKLMQRDYRKPWKHPYKG
ncbi:MAG: Gfo/Idh/MocA family oxidoreductase [Sedimentisphaerales bacterium]|nr:Gfo/Idh/MocA family oxidoreductase [Sedimentisphaerales bacterium]